MLPVLADSLGGDSLGTLQPLPWHCALIRSLPSPDTARERMQSGSLTYGDSTPAFFEDPQLLAKRALTDVDVGVDGDWILCCQAVPTSDMEIETSPATPVGGDPNQALKANA